jgi:hypothetical protein
MKAQLTFDLNDPEDRMAHLRCVKSTDMAIVLWDIVFNMKKRTERTENLERVSVREILDVVFQEIDDQLSINGIVIDDLIQ